MIEKFREKRFNPEKLILLERIKEILKEFEKQNIAVTLRQLYYQLVSRDLIPNRVQEYAKLSTLLTDARYCGIIDWSAIEDRIRIPEMHSEFEDVLDLIKSAKASYRLDSYRLDSYRLDSYRLDRWKGQEYYIELWTEKDALSSILSPIAEKWHIHFCVNRGYTSATAIYDAHRLVYF